MENKINLAFLFHMHQPVYRYSPLTFAKKQELNSIEYALPWVRLHAAKDYYDFAAILDEFPGIKMTFNVVPSLLIQLEDYAKCLAHDRHMDMTLKKSVQLNNEEKKYILNEFFLGHFETMIKPYERYRQLYELKEKTKADANAFSSKDLLDLQAWSNLAWMDPYWRKNDPLVASLFKKQKGFTEDDKQKLVSKQREICGKVIGKYKQLFERGQVDFSVSPFYHPILPLLCNSDIAKVAMPEAKLPNKFSYPEDAQTQICKAVEYYKKVFGKKPEGMWPPEGSVSEDMVGITKDCGINWIASDEEIFFKSASTSHLGLDSSQEALYQPYKIQPQGSKKSLDIVFRDKNLSDAFSFYYHKLETKDALEHFFSRLYMIKKNTENRNIPNSLVSVILDGENCWEYYKNDGWDLLTELYSRLQSDKNIVTTKISEFIKKSPPEKTLDRLHPGSWINSNFKVWIGHPEDNKAWNLTIKAKEKIQAFIKEKPDKKNSSEYRQALEELYIAEGSDWYWWFGDENYSGQANIFDLIFRTHLMNIYKLLAYPVPNELYNTIKGSFN